MASDPPVPARWRDDVLVVIPALNERDCIADVVAEVREAGFGCVVIDDGSTDDTARRATAAGADVVRLPINLGVGGALRTGFRYAVDHGVRCVVQVDADGQHVAEHIDELLDALEARDLDMVIGSRFADQGAHPMSRARRACIHVLAATATPSGRPKITDPTSGFRAIRSPLLDAFARDFPHHYLGDTYEALFIAQRRGYRIAEVPVLMRERQGGRASADLVASVRALVRVGTVLFTGSAFDLPERSTLTEVDP